MKQSFANLETNINNPAEDKQENKNVPATALEKIRTQTANI